MLNICSLHFFFCLDPKRSALTRTEVVVFEDVALEAAAGGEVLGAVGHGTAGPQGAGILLVFLGMDVQAAAC